MGPVEIPKSARQSSRSQSELSHRVEKGDATAKRSDPKYREATCAWRIAIPQATEHVTHPLAVCHFKGGPNSGESQAGIEKEVTRILRENFCFRFIEIAEQYRMGNKGLERALIGTLASCPHCGPSAGWLGNYSPKSQICDSGLRLIQYLKAAPISPSQQELIAAAIERSCCAASCA